MIRLEGTPGSVWSLTRSGFAGIFRSAFFWIAICYSVLIVGIRTTIIFVFGTFSEDPEAQQEFIRFLLDEGFLPNTIRWQIVAIMVVIALVGTRTVARDRMLGGLEFILSKSIPPWGYVLSRILTPTLASLLLLFVPVLLMVVLTFMLLDTVPAERVSQFWGTVGAAFVISVVLGVLGSAVGSLVASPRKAVVIWLLVVVATIPLGAFAREIGADWHWLVGPVPLLYATTFTLIDTPFPGNHVVQGWVALGLLVVASIGVMAWRVREVVR